MSTIPIYIKSLTIKNIKTFGEVCIDFERPDGILPNWTLLLGDNGIGKSTLLHCIAWMKPFLPYRRSEIPPDFEPAPIINDEENETLVSLVRKTQTPIEAKLEAKFESHKILNKKPTRKKASYCSTEMKIGLDKNGRLKEVEPKLLMSEKNSLFYNNEVIIYGYSASRTLGKQNLGDTNLENTIPSFIAESTKLYDAEEILHTVNYAALASPRKERAKYKRYQKRISEMLASLLPDIEHIKSIEVLSPSLVDNQLKSREFVITTRHGKKIPFNDFSLGYKTVVSWTIDLSWRLFQKYSSSANPLSEPAIVLVDEIDLHLHPLWQREIIGNLSRHFPRVQFIATAHSPLMVQAALDANYAVLKYDESGVEILNEPGGVDGWRVDQILTSEFFGLKTARPPEYDALLQRRNQLIKKRNKTDKEEGALRNVIQKLSEYPIGETPAEIESRKLIADMVEKIKKEQKEISL